MTVRDLVEKLSYADPDALVVLSGTDHSYHVINFPSECTAIQDGTVIFVDHDGDLEDGEQRINVVVL